LHLDGSWFKRALKGLFWCERLKRGIEKAIKTNEKTNCDRR
jgi:hypothetical protein